MTMVNSKIMMTILMFFSVMLSLTEPKLIVHCKIRTLGPKLDLIKAKLA